MIDVNPVYRYRAKLTRIQDGDSWVLLVDVGFRAYVSVLARLRDVNCPELRTPEGDKAAEFVKLLLEGKPLLVESYKDQRSFARWICDCWVIQDGEAVSVADALVEAGHAVRVQYRSIPDSTSPLPAGAKTHPSGVRPLWTSRT
jgi:micrococcal nuclease